MRDKLQYQLKKKFASIIIAVLIIPLIIIFILITQSIDMNKIYMQHLGKLGVQRISQYIEGEEASISDKYVMDNNSIFVMDNTYDTLDIEKDLLGNKRFLDIYNTDIKGNSGYLFFNPHRKYSNEIIISYSQFNDSVGVIYVQELPKAITDKNNLNILIFVLMLMGGAILIRLVFQFSELIIIQFLKITESYSKATKEKEDMEERLLISEKLASMGRITSGIAHEIGNPLSSIISTSQLLKNYNLKEKKRDYFIDKIHDEAKRIDSLINDLLYFKRNGVAEFEKVNINEIIIKSLESIPENRKPDRVSIYKDLSRNIPDVLGDDKRLTLAFTNVILNGIQSIKDEGMVSVRTLRQDSFIIAKIKDTGTGISRDEINKIFDPFFTTKEVGKGFGLGLFICQQIIESHNGKIIINSEEGKGTEFIIKIPM